MGACVLLQRLSVHWRGLLILLMMLLMLLLLLFVVVKLQTLEHCVGWQRADAGGARRDDLLV